MENLPDLLRAVASLLWPVIVVILLFAFRDAIRQVIRSAQSRKFTVKVGEMEVEMDEYNRQQSELIKDLQNQVVSLQKAIEGGQTPGQADPQQATVPDYSLEAAPRPRSVLWVGDHPHENAVMLQNLQDAGIQVTTALSSREGLTRLRAAPFDTVVTDLDHPNGTIPAGSVPGIELIKAIRQMDENIPVYVFTSPRKAEKMCDAAQDAGANQVTASPTILLALLKD
jgi:CheY-like chemotaxis protein